MRTAHALAPFVAALACAAPFACSTSTSTSTAGECTVPAIPPPSADAAPATSGARAVFAITKLYLGDTDRAGSTNQSAWKAYGRNIDGKVTTRTSTDVCRLARGAALSTQIDGCSGIDNSFGQDILPILLTTLGQDEGRRTNDAIARGQLTNLVVVEGLGYAGAQSSLRASLLLGADLTAGGASWGARSDSFMADASSARIAFDAAYLTNGTFVAAPPSLVEGPIWFGAGRGSTPLVLQATRVEIVATLSDDQRTLSNGTISGIISLESLLDVARRIAGGFSTSLCVGSALESALTQIRQAADILADGTQDPTRDCDAISFGLGFEASRTTLGPVVDPVVSPDPCADAGAPDASDAAPATDAASAD